MIADSVTRWRKAAGFLALALASFLALCPALAQSPSNQAGQEGSKVEVQLFQLKYARATEVTRLVSELFGKSREPVVAVAESGTNAIVVAGPAAELAKIKDLIAKVDLLARDSDAMSQQQVWLIPLRHIDADQTLAEALRLVFKQGPGNFALDRQRKQVIVSGDVETYKALVKLIEGLDQAGRPAPGDAEVKVRVVWLASGKLPDNAPEVPADLKELLPGLAKLGVDKPRLVAQTLVTATGTGQFQAKGMANLDAAVDFAVTGQFLDREMRGLKITIEAAKGQSEICRIRTEISAPPGHLVLLGVTPSGNQTSVFVVQVLPGEVKTKK
jgi:hypothetical protein